MKFMLRNKLRFLVGGIALLLILLTLFYAVKFRRNQELDKLNTAVSMQDYSLAIELLENNAWLCEDTAPLKEYCRAMVLLKETNVNEAKNIFAELKSYKDSAQQLKQAEQYIKACASPLIKAYDLFTQLGNFADSQQMAAVKLDEIFAVGSTYFNTEEYSSAKRFFDVLPVDYNTRAEKYIKICNIIEQTQKANEHGDTQSEFWGCYVACVMAEEYGFAKVKDYVMQNHLQAFLNGNWRNDIGGYFNYEHSTDTYKSNLVYTGLTLKPTTNAASISDWRNLYFEYLSPDKIRFYYNNYYCDMTREE